MRHIEKLGLRRKRDCLSQTQLMALVEYNPDTGIFTNLVNRFRAKAGSIAGHLDTRSGYWRIKIGGVSYEAHRLAMLYMNGQWPTLVDHVNGKRSDNRWLNLRIADFTENRANSRLSVNNRSGQKGVRVTPSGRWRAEISVRGKRICIGTFDTLEEASSAYATSAKKYFGEYAKPCGNSSKGAR